MVVVFIILMVAGVEVSATTPPRKSQGRCPTAPIECGPNSHFEKCSKICPPQNCSFLIDPHWLCENPGYKPECRCNDGFYRNQNGTCISRHECLAQCGPLERYVADSSDCQRTCANYKVTAPRSLCKPYSGCVCEGGRVRLNDDATGPCVLTKDCKPRPCPLHEHLEDCPSVCANETCISKSPNYKCILPAIPLPCKSRCMCDKGYLRNQFGDCIPDNHCPIKECPINEVWRCASMCPQDSCKRLEPGFHCPQGIISVCIPACTCKDGYLRDDDGFCMPSDFCPASLRCDINEVAVECQAYPPQTCESVYTLYKPIEDPPCNPGCDCRPGYLRNKRNICVPSEFCPTVPHHQCGPNQEYKKCGSSCEPSCSDLDDPPQVCPDVCIEGCFCKDGFFKDDRGYCVLKEDCPLPMCNKPNEVAKDCGSYCEMRTCEDYNRTDIVCPAVCVRGCFCREGYVRNAYGVCIRKEKCPSKPVCLQKHEEYQSCGSSCPDNCDNYMNPDRICTMQCVAGCNCKPGYVRNLKDGTCIKPDQCPTKECTGVNEELNYCASYCPITCANRYTQGDWACITLCREACDCIPGTLRNDTGDCVPVNQCTPPICRENEKYMKCGTACPITCDNFKNPPKKCTHQCIEDCFCKDGYVRNRFGRCVKPEQCEPICPAGEKWNECSAHCQDTCENYNSSNRVCTYQCQSGCVCKQGTVRRKDGQCVRPTECNNDLCPANEVYDPCVMTKCPPGMMCAQVCKPGCKCKDGYVRDKEGKCVDNNLCPANEVYDPCVMSKCPPGMMCAQVCKPGCKCKDGYVRDKEGKCVAISKPCSDLNAIRNKCASHESCRATCAVPNSRNCPKICIVNECECKKGYVLSEPKGKCIKIEDCPKGNVSCNGDPNAGIMAYPPPCPSTCKMPNGIPGCPLIGLDVGCQCKPGYLKDDNGKCIQPDNCKGGNPCGANATFSWCRVNCPNNRCPVDDSRGIIACDPPYPCPSGCVCKLNYRRKSQKDDRCILAPDCPRINCTRPNEEWSSCPSACLRENCKDVNNQPTTCNTLVFNCNPMCICKKGHFRNATDICVPAKDCPNKQPCDDPNAEWSDCAPASSCQSTCARPNPSPCILSCAVNGCVCKKGFVLSKEGGKCIPVDQCPKDVPCNGDSNAVIKANPPPCPSTCKSPNASYLCRRAAPPVACQCKDGYIQATDGGKCVKPDECPGGNPCGQNATFVPCVIGCPTNNCPVDNSTAIVACSPPYPCPSGCACKKGYKRISSSDDTCILISDCPPPIKCKANEVYNTCRIKCPPQMCASIYTSYNCQNTAKCEPGCDCISEYLRNGTENDPCIPSHKCPTSPPVTPDCGINEHYETNSNKCELTCKNYHLEPTMGPCQATSTCFCDDGYVRNSNGMCIHKKRCPQNIKCPQNEVLSECYNSCHKTCKTRLRSDGKMCQLACIETGCLCKEGYMRHDNGTCVPINQCSPPRCNANETYSKCGTACPPTCQNRGDNCTVCTEQCVEDCFCNKGLVRADDGISCIKPKECSPRICGPNETFMPCPPTCPPTDGCSNMWSKFNCTNAIKCCKPQCRCKSGYLRKDKVCVPTEQCLN